MSEFHFGLGRGKIPVVKEKKIDKIARKHDCAFVAANIPGNGHMYWFAGPNRGEPFNSQIAKAVLIEVGDLLPRRL